MRRAAAALTAAAVAAVTVLPAPAVADDGQRLLERAVRASRELAYTGLMTIASFSDRGPQLTEVEVTRGRDGGLRVARGDAWEVGRRGEEAFLRQPRTGTLLRLGGVEALAFDPERLAEKYEILTGDVRRLDTGPARMVVLRERATDVDRERLYLDEDSGLVVRRETFSLAGDPVRVAAFTALEVTDLAVPALEVGEDEDEQRRTLSPLDLERLESDTFVVPSHLGAGYRLTAGYVVDRATVPTRHLVYSDGLYTLSLYQQQGRLATHAVEGATRLVTERGGQVWRWPGSEPRRIVWAGDGITFTVLSDAPTDELLTAIADLPHDPPPSILVRLGRGLSRVGEWLWPFGRG